jgi:hypothetical protein
MDAVNPCHKGDRSWLKQCIEKADGWEQGVLVEVSSHSNNHGIEGRLINKY